jgi:hypothetical protein
MIRILDRDPPAADKNQWPDITDELSARYKTIQALSSFMNDNLNHKALLVDTAIEKTHRKLTQRANSYFTLGMISLAFCMTISIAFAGYLFLALPSPRIEAPFTNELYNFILILIKRITAGGIVLGISYILAANANSCFRESTILLHRRHALRYVRLALISEGKIPVKDLRDIFGLDDVTNTGFDKIKVESIRDNLIGKLIDAVGTASYPARQGIGDAWKKKKSATQVEDEPDSIHSPPRPATSGSTPL